MKIKTIEYENFRNFKDRGKITFSTDGRVTIIYGHSGDGKTTLHQLFQWVLYGKVNFNKTATDKLYNLQDEHDRKYGEEFNVFGEIEFEHDGDDYLLRRTHMYKKELKDSRLISEEFTLHKFDKKNYDWKKVSRINELVEEFLPSGLKDYFFFDGESMIADLRVKGKDSASSLKKALYNMFDLDILQNAIDHIGRTDLTTTVLGKLYIDKANGVDSKEVQECKINIENAQKRIEQFKEKKFELEHEKQNLHDVSQNVSEQIGSLKSKMQYETERRTYKKQCEAYNNALLQAQAEFGDALFQMVPQRLISKTVIDAKAKINLKVENTDLPSGITKKLIHYLLDEKNENCICGRKLDLESKQQIANYLLLMPPKSYASLYHEFSQAAKRQGEVYDKNYIEEIITRAVQNQQLMELSIMV